MAVEYSSVHKKLKQSLTADRSQHAQKLAAQIGMATPGELYSKLRELGIGACFRKRGKKALPMLYDESGNVAATFEDAQKSWMHFAKALEFGVEDTQRGIWRRCVREYLRQSHDPPKMQWQFIPSIQRVEQYVRQVKPAKATGPDGLISELFHYFPAELTPHIHALLTKMCCHNSEPVSSKGGVLVRAYKGRGSTLEPSNYRGLLISNHLSKILHASLRDLLLPFFTCHALPLQLGGRRGSTVSMASHMVRLFLGWTKRCAMSSALLFLDVQTAFYRVLRPLIAKHKEFHRQLIEIIQFFDLDPEAYQELCQALDEPTAMHQAGVPTPLENLVAEAHANTWFSTPGRDELIRTRGGTRPGDPFADLIFNFLFSKVMKKVKLALAQEDLLIRLNWSGQRELHPPHIESDRYEDLCEVIWADDVAIMLTAPDGESLPGRAARASAIVIDIVTRYGLKPNLGRGKTEIILCVRGKGSVKVRKQLFDAPDPQLIVHSNFVPDCTIRIVTKYTHLGGQTVVNAKDGPEMVRRLAQARAIYDKYKKRLFQSSAIDLATRVGLMEPFILSVVQFNMGTWTNFTNRDLLKASGSMYKLYKGLLRPSFPKQQVDEMSHDEVLARVQLPSLETQIHVARLRHFVHLWQRAPPIAWALLEHEQSWLEKTRQSFLWLYQNLSTTIALPPPMEDWEPWKDLFKSAPGKWKSFLKRAAKHATLQTALQWSNRYWHAIIMEQAHRAGLPELWRQPNMKYVAPLYVCPPCQMRFSSKSAWSVHTFRKHGRAHFLRQFASGSTCLRCCKHYWNPVRLVHHLKYSKACADYMMRHAPSVEITPGINSRQHNKIEFPSLCPPVDTAVEVDECDRPLMNDPECEPFTDLVSDLLDILLQDISTDPDFGLKGTLMNYVRQFRTTLQKYPLSFEHIQITWKAFVDDWQTVIHEEFSVAVCSAWANVINHISLFLSPAWLVPQREFETPHPDRDAPFVWLQDQTHFDDIPLLPLVTPMPACKERYVIHVFSGRRREGDLQASLEKLVSPDHTLLHVLSLDVVFGQEANLFDVKARARWIFLFQQKLVWGFYSGPPCETWSAARFVELDNSRVRPVRAAKTPWGLPAMAISELKQVVVGNLLMYFVLLLMVIQVGAGLFGLMEHPAEPYEQFKPSIWRTPLWRFMLRLNLRTIKIWQGYHRAPSPKPTKFGLTVPIPRLSQIFLRHQVRYDLPQQVSVGRNADGTFATAILKEYPPSLCSALAECFGIWVTNVPTVDRPSVEPAVADFLSSFEAKLDAVMGSDYIPPSSRLIHFA